MIMMEDDDTPFLYREDICQPPKGRSRRSTMFAYRKHRVVDVSSSPENCVNRMQQGSDTSPSSVGNELLAKQRPVPPADSWASPPEAQRGQRASPVKKAMRLGLEVQLDVSNVENQCGSPYTASPPEQPKRAACRPLTLDSPTPRQPLASMPLDRLSDKKVAASPLFLQQPLDPVRSSAACALSPLLEPLAHSPAQMTALIARQKAIIEALNADMANLRAVANGREDQLHSLQFDLAQCKARDSEQTDRVAMAKEEIDALQFTVSIVEQKVLELQDAAALAAIDNHEAIAHRNKKYKAALARVNKEKKEYEERANAVIQQMNEQMSSLQTMAMERIEALEKELMDSRRENEELRLRNQLQQESNNRQQQQQQQQWTAQRQSLPPSPSSEGSGSRRSTASPVRRTPAKPARVRPESSAPDEDCVAVGTPTKQTQIPDDAEPGGQQQQQQQQKVQENCEG